MAKKKKCISQYELNKHVFPGALGTTDETLTFFLGVTAVRKKSFRHLASKLPCPSVLAEKEDTFLKLYCDANKYWYITMVLFPQ